MLRALRAPHYTKAILTTSAACFQDGLWGDFPASSAPRATESEGLGGAAHGLRHFDRDGHSANHVLMAWLITVEDTTSYISDHVCSSHSNNLCEVATIFAVCDSVLSRMYSATLLLQMGGHFLRLAGGVETLVQRHVAEPLIDAIAGCCPDFLEELADYAMSNYLQFEYAVEAHVHADSSDEEGVEGDSASGGRRRPGALRTRRIKEDWRKFMDFFTWHPRMGLVHVGRGASRSDMAYVREAACILSSVILRSAPTVPNAAKWTKVGPCVDWFLVPLQLQLLRPLFSISLGKLAYTHDAAKPGEEATWHQIAGKRAAVTDQW